MKEITLAGGCFWGVEAYFKLIPGIISTKVGYANGDTKEPTYKEVCSGTTNHVEACKIKYNEEKIQLKKILKYLFKIIDPTILNRQGNDKGTQYRTGIYYNDSNEKIIIDNFINEVRSNYSSPIVTEVLPLDYFYNAEEYHQDYLTKNPGGYCHIDLENVKI